jgi:hypothetical protein
VGLLRASESFISELQVWPWSSGRHCRLIRSKIKGEQSPDVFFRRRSVPSDKPRSLRANLCSYRTGCRLRASAGGCCALNGSPRGHSHGASARYAASTALLMREGSATFQRCLAAHTALLSATIWQKETGRRIAQKLIGQKLLVIKLPPLDLAEGFAFSYRPRSGADKLP